MDCKPQFQAEAPLMGWLWLLAIGLAAFAMLWFGGMSRSLATLSGAALLVGGAGYALQNHASLSGSPAQSDIKRIDVDPGLVAFRSAIMPGTADDAALLAAADDQMREGDTNGAVQRLQDALNRRPDDAALWTGLGSAIVAHDGGQLSPAAQYAFRRAFQLAPTEPGPPFFLGMAHVQAGDMVAAKRAWLLALSLSPRDAPYRIDIAERLVMIDQFMAMQAAGAGPR